MVDCQAVQPDPRESLQYVNLNLTNNVPKSITRVTMRLVYCDANGQALKEWTTQRELDHNLAGKETEELRQPAYFMPLYTRRVKVEIKQVHFADGTDWPR
jgi:hypothetical protein